MASPHQPGLIDTNVLIYILNMRHFHMIASLVVMKPY